jgi:3-phenylpropionate/trans-cinnamate dioxygenase ferredoxin reductase subunit
MSRGIVIAGGGQAGLQAALSLREQGWGGAITIVSNEAYLPYQRPPLSKGFLSGDVQARQLELRPATVLAEAGVEVVLETEVTGIDRERRIVATTRGELPYLDLILAMGGAPRRLAQVPAGCTNLLYLRTLDDALRLREAMTGASRIVIVGGGFLGLEAAASAAKAGKSVCVVEASPKLLQRSVHPLLATRLATLHRARGVDIHMDSPARLLVEGDRVTGVEIPGQVLPCDLVIVAIGLVPNTSIAEAAGLSVGDGILVDRELRTTDPHIFAIGDCARLESGETGQTTRLESVQGAIEHGKAVAATIVRGHMSAPSVPWFWSHQYDHQVQVAGIGGDEEPLVFSDDERFVLCRFDKGRLKSVETLDSPADHMRARRLLAKVPPTRGELEAAGGLAVYMSSLQ